MKLDKEEDRALLLELIDRAAFPGAIAEKVVELKRAIKQATIEVDKSSSVLTSSRMIEQLMVPTA